MLFRLILKGDCGSTVSGIKTVPPESIIFLDLKIKILSNYHSFQTSAF